MFSDAAWTVQNFVAILIATVDEYGVERRNECGSVHGAQDFCSRGIVEFSPG